MKRSIRGLVFIPFLGKRKRKNDEHGQFQGSEQYWIQRYASGRTSGIGSYGKLAEFKADVLNSFVKEKDIRSVIEYGCGDGSQLKLAEYMHYIGFDISPKAISLCKFTFKRERNKVFKMIDNYAGETADLSLSLDVIYHLVEDQVFESYMQRLFKSANRFVVIFSTNTDEQMPGQPPHMHHRKFTDWIVENHPGWRLIRHVPNLYPYKGDFTKGSMADFYIYEKS